MAFVLAGSGNSEWGPWRPVYFNLAHQLIGVRPQEELLDPEFFGRTRGTPSVNICLCEGIKSASAGLKPFKELDDEAELASATHGETSWDRRRLSQESAEMAPSSELDEGDFNLRLKNPFRAGEYPVLKPRDVIVSGWEQPCVHEQSTDSPRFLIGSSLVQIHMARNNLQLHDGRKQAHG